MHSCLQTGGIIAHSTRTGADVWRVTMHVPRAGNDDLFMLITHVADTPSSRLHFYGVHEHCPTGICRIFHCV